MSKTLIVAWREFTQTVMRKVFLLAVVGMPVVFLGLMVLMVKLMVDQEEPPLVGTLAMVDPSGETAPAAQIEFDNERIRREAQKQAQQMAKDAMAGNPTNFSAAAATSEANRGDVRITIEEKIEGDIDSLKNDVLAGTLLALAVIPAEVLEIPDPDAGREPRFELFVAESVDSDNVNLIERRIGASVVRVRAERNGLDPDRAMAMIDRPDADTGRASAGDFASENRATRVARQMVPAAFFMLIWIGALVSGQNLMMSTIEEKSNRVMEVLLSAVSPLQLMTGKILGFGGVGLLIVAVYGSVAIAALVLFAVFSQYVQIMDLVYFGVFYFMAYFMIASLMAAVGSAVSDIREANTLATPVMMLLMIPWMLWMPITQAPNGTIATACSFIPPMIPFAMILRLSAEEPITGAAWQIPLSIVWGYFCVFAMIWGAGKIFRVGVLMYGKPPSPLELIKWLRYS